MKKKPIPCVILKLKFEDKLLLLQMFQLFFTSVLTKQRLLKAIETAVEVFENRKRRISTSKLNETMLEIVQQNSPPATKGKFVKIKYCMQLPTPTPQFAFFSNLTSICKRPLQAVC